MRKKKLLALVLAAACIMGASSYATVAYMSDNSQATNTLAFVGKDGLNAQLTEPSWVPSKGLLLVPNQSIPKDPQVTNTSEIDLDELVALKLEFVYTDSCPDKSKVGKTLSIQDMSYVVDVYDINYNSDDTTKQDWVRFSGESKTSPVQNFYYKDVLERNYPGAGETTIPLFTKVSIDKSVNNTRYARVQAIGGFDIKISGHVIQQMTGEKYFGLNSAADAYASGLFDFNPEY